MPASILNLLNDDHAYVSGQEISTRLDITRAAVWKKITVLRRRGFVIEAAPSKGYRLISAPDLAADYLLPRVRSALWKTILVHDVVASTNDLAMSLAAEEGIGHGTVIVADRQTRGKGRLGRRWESPGGKNIYMSLIIRPELSPPDLTMLTVLAAVAGARAIQNTGDIPAKIKWPNDLMIDDKKLGGILTEVRSDPDRISLAVIGIGINVNMRSADFPGGLRSIATSMRSAAGHAIARNALIIQLLREFEHWYGILTTEGKRLLLHAWRKHSATLGRRVSVTVGNEKISGIAEDINDNGMLRLKMHSGQYRNISAGDITFLR